MAEKSRKLEWKWTEQRERTALLLAHDNLTDIEIAKEIGISPATIYLWRAIPEFAARIEEHLVVIRAEIRRTGIAIVENRVARKQADWDRLEAIRIARAISAQIDPEMISEGGSTGLVLRRVKSVRSGMESQLITEYSIDTAMLAERSRLEEDVAKELGQRVERHEVETRDVSISEGLDNKIESLAKRLESP